jgi:hypothetical protein
MPPPNFVSVASAAAGAIWCLRRRRPSVTTVFRSGHRSDQPKTYQEKINGRSNPVGGRADSQSVALHVYNVPPLSCKRHPKSTTAYEQLGHSAWTYLNAPIAGSVHEDERQYASRRIVADLFGRTRWPVT